MICGIANAPDRCSSVMAYDRSSGEAPRLRMYRAIRCGSPSSRRTAALTRSIACSASCRPSASSFGSVDQRMARSRRNAANPRSRSMATRSLSVGLEPRKPRR